MCGKNKRPTVAGSNIKKKKKKNVLKQFLNQSCSVFKFKFFSKFQSNSDFSLEQLSLTQNKTGN